MGVVISKPAINIREQLTELKAQQGYEERQFHFDNLVINGTFDTDTSGWSVSTYTNGSISFNSGALRITTDTGTNGRALSSPFNTTIGQWYVVEVEGISRTSGTYRLEVRSGVNSADTWGSGTVSRVFQAVQATTFIELYAIGGAGIYAEYDNVSVYEVDPADDKVIHTIPKGWKPLHVFEDGVLQREGSAYDYTVEYDGFNYIVKETVAPVAPYSTTVIGVRA